MRKVLNVLIACEESQAETMAFRSLGHRAFSCDIQPCRKGTPAATHIVGDVRPLFSNKVTFHTQDGKRHQVSHWDLIIAHPPCTYICKISSPFMVKNGVVDENRYKLMLDAVAFFNECYNAPAKYVAVENPLPMARANLPKPSCFIHPSWFGVKYTKKTLFWLRNLPPLMPTIEHPKPRVFVRASRGKYRSRTFPQVAEAMAKQWSEYILDDLNKTTKDQ